MPPSPQVEPARWYYHADRLGVLVWQDMPSPPALTCISAADGDPKWVHDPRAVEASDNGDKDINREPCALDRREFASSALRVARFLAFSPAVVLWVVHNEAWGQGTGAAQGADTAAITAALHHLDPGRLVTDASGWQLSVPTPRLPPPAASAAFPLARPCGAGVDCGDVVDVHAYPGPWPSAAARHRWYG